MGFTATEWKDGEGGLRVDYFITSLTVIFLLWVLIQLGNEPSSNPDVLKAQYFMNLFLIMLIIVLIAWGLDAIGDKVSGIISFWGQYVSFGENESIALLSISIGIILGIIMNLNLLTHNTASVFLAIGVPAVSTALGISIRGLIVGILSPIIEEKFFGQFLPYSLEEVFGGWFKNLSFIPAWILTCAAFGLFHWSAYGAAISFMISAMIFRFIILVGNTIIRSAGFGFGLHLAHNILFLTAGGSI